MSDTWYRDPLKLAPVEQLLYDLFRGLGCPAVVDSVDPEDCAGMAVEIVRVLRQAGWLRDEPGYDRQALLGALNAAKLAGVQEVTADGFAYRFRSNVQAADVAWRVVVEFFRPLLARDPTGSEWVSGPAGSTEAADDQPA